MNDRDLNEARAIVEQYRLGSGWTGDPSIILQEIDRRGLTREPSSVITITDDIDQRVVLRRSDGTIAGEGEGDTIEAATHAALKQVLEADKRA